MTLRIEYLTLFPAMFGYLECSILGRAKKAGVWDYGVHDMREHATDPHRSVDDRPFGGGVGMVLKPAIAEAALAALSLPPTARVVAPSPQGRPFDHATAQAFAAAEGPLVFLCGHYEGLDERIYEELVTDEVSLGDYVLTGGELAALVMTDAVVRLLPGAMGKDDSPKEDSFYDGLLDCPHYTRPAEWRGRSVPEALMSGDHARIRRWRRQEALRRTFERRPELLAQASLDAQERAWLRDLAAGRAPRDS